jgi:hypothetical protein
MDVTFDLEFKGFGFESDGLGFGSGVFSRSDGLEFWK